MIVWDKPYYYIKGKPFIPEIGKNAVCIQLNGQLNSDLNWHEASSQAQQAVNSGISILWEMDLGLFDNLKLPLDNHTQFLSLGLSLNHFRDTLLPKFKENSLGISIFKGYIESAEINEAAQYLSLVVDNFKAEIPVYVTLDVSKLKNPLQQALYLHPQRWGSLQLNLHHSLVPVNSLGKVYEANLALCLPELEFDDLEKLEPLGNVMQKLLQKNIAFRLIAENQLTYQWDGLDQLIYLPAVTSTLGMRKLQGFAAAGGQIIPAELFE